jgi:molecular chaperone DnaK
MYIGLDFGTCFLRAGVFRDGRFRGLTVPGGGQRLSTTCLLDKTGVLNFGASAASGLILNPGRGGAALKRFLGMRDPLLFRNHYPYPYETSKKFPPVLNLPEHRKTVEQVVSDLLILHRKSLEQELGEVPEGAVVGVPDHLPHAARLSLRSALEKAGYGPVHLLNDSLAAGLTLRLQLAGTRPVLAVILGAGYGTLALLSAQGQVFETLNAVALDGLDGDDLDFVLAERLTARFKESFGLLPQKDPTVAVRLQGAARTLREKLSAGTIAPWDLPYLPDRDGQPRHFQGTLTRDELEELYAPQRAALDEALTQALEEVRLTARSLHGVILAGLPTMMPLVQGVLTERGLLPLKGVQPEFLCVRGAALYAAMLEGKAAKVRVFEVTGSTVHLLLPTRKIVTAIPRRTPRPVRKEFVFDPEAEKWPSRTVTLLQGDLSDSGKPSVLGTYPLSSLTAKKLSGDKLRVTVAEDADGIVSLALHHPEKKQERPILSLEDRYRQRGPSLDPADFPAGAVVADRFQVEHQIGSGGFSFIYRVKDLDKEQLSALKILRPKFNLDAVVLERFRRSAEGLLDIHHPNICQIHEFFFDDGMYIINLEYIEGWNLEEFQATEQFQQLDIPRRVSLLSPVIAAMRQLREHDILHADLKPANIMVTPKLVPKLIDFELSQFLKMEPIEEESVTGTPKYFSPEHVAAKQSFGEHSDIYSFGLILYQVLTGTFPKKEHKPEADYMFSVLELGKNVQPVHPSKVNRKIPTALGDIVVRCVLMSRTERYQKFEDLEDDLERFAEG